MPRPSRTEARREESRLELSIESLAAGGDGVGRDDGGRVVFVPRTAPGDRVRVKVVSGRKRFARAELLELLEPGPSRVEPACRYFGRCGGCAWQHVDYAAQVEAKASIVQDALCRIGGFDAEAVPITPSPRPLGYRGRARLVQEGGGLGYRERRSHRVVTVDRCPVLDPRLEQVLASQRPAHEGSDGTEWEAALGGDGEPRLDRIGAPGGRVDLDVGADRLRVSHEVFAQANRSLLPTLVDRVLARCADGGGAPAVSAVELYAGAGLFTLGLALRFDQVWAVESHPGAALDLRFNLERAQRDNVRVEPGDVELVLPTLGIRAPDLVLLDPPRTGIGPLALEAIVALEPRRIVYLSCDPATFARDLKGLCDAGYALGPVEAFDLFPQTPHVEALAELTRR